MVHRVRAAALVGVAALLLAACGGPVHPTAQPPNGRLPIQGPSTGAGSRCATTVHGVVAHPGSLAPGFVPPGFRRAGSGQSARSVPSVTYSLAGATPDPPRIELRWSNRPEPLGAANTPSASKRQVNIQGHPGLLASGAPAPAFVGASWKHDASDLLSVVGYKLPAATVLEVAAHVVFSPPGWSPGPLTQGRP